uniref:Transcriptional regulator, GntR family domain / Aspartate aminotransferase (EC) n=1 Tax=uncultured Thiotrichaceae bacterium TaxID=298394 RepID=A0A6S6SQA4_9GAMM|nr:MAG: Transcriptional regulator, GntR family domain / Aspartate aminotransferase (EC [uncultured Thiotrichaceae bacterium]
MSTHLFHLGSDRSKTLQTRVREMMVSAILDGYLQANERLPSPRILGKELGVARNTVIEAYKHLADDGYLYVQERRGYFVSARSPDEMSPLYQPQDSGVTTDTIDWSQRLVVSMEGQRNIVKARNWQSFTYPFVTGQLDPLLFPVSDWRDCCRGSMNPGNTLDWAADHCDTDTVALIDQLRSRVLPRRGINATPDEILTTMGAQHALYILSSLLMWGKCIGIEEPGYPDARNIFSLKAERMVELPVDDEGLVVGEHLAGCDYVYITPSHQSPTTVTMSLDRRRALLKAAEQYDFIIMEDDYEGESNYSGQPTPALRSLDRNGRVIYIGSLSKVLAPGLRLGYLVASEELIYEARSLRRLMLRHVPGNNESAIALFLSRGHYDVLIRRLRRNYKERWQVMHDAIDAYLPDYSSPSNYGGTAFWLKGPEHLDSRMLQRMAAQSSILIETGDVYFQQSPQPLNYFRLGLSSIPVERIEPGVKKLAEIIGSIIGSIA